VGVFIPMSFLLVAPTLCVFLSVGFRDENEYLQFAVSTLVPFWKPQRLLPQYGTPYIPPQDTEPKKVDCVWAVLWDALGGKWGLAQ
jgi:hypothetical protein